MQALLFCVYSRVNPKKGNLKGKEWNSQIVFPSLDKTKLKIWAKMEAEFRNAESGILESLKLFFKIDEDSEGNS